jgi:hypothetical protein
MAPQEESDPTETNKTNTAPAEKSEELKQLENKKGLSSPKKPYAASKHLIKEHRPRPQRLGASPPRGGV